MEKRSFTFRYKYLYNPQTLSIFIGLFYEKNKVYQLAKKSEMINGSPTMMNFSKFALVKIRVPSSGIKLIKSGANFQ